MNNFDADSQQVLALARKEADRLQNDFVGVEHLALGIIKHENCSAAKILVGLNVDLARLKEKIENATTPPVASDKGNIPYTPRVKAVLASANKEAKKIKDNFVGTQHLLLGLLKDGEGIPARILKNMACSYDSVFAAYIRMRDENNGDDFSPDDLHEQGTWPDTGLEAARNEPFTVWIDPGDSSTGEIKELFASISELYRAFGGSGLDFVKDEEKKPIILCNS